VHELVLEKKQENHRSTFALMAEKACQIKFLAFFLKMEVQTLLLFLPYLSLHIIVRYTLRDRQQTPRIPPSIKPHKSRFGC